MTIIDIPEIEYREMDDPEFTAIKNGVSLVQVIEFMKDRDIEGIRLPVNNPTAYQYLRWLNAHWLKDESCYVTYILNLWDEYIMPKRVRPPTPRELVICSAKRIVELANNNDEKNDIVVHKNMFIDTNAELIRDAYLYWNYPAWIESGLAGCIMKFGTFEDNLLKPGDESNYVTYEDHEAVN